MPFYLRAINRTRWSSSPRPTWLLKNEIPAQALADFVPRPAENLSLWYIEDDRLNVDRVAAAIASARTKLDKLDYATFSIDIIKQLDLKVVQSPGTTPDATANTQWHWELIELSANKANLLVHELYPTIQKARLMPDVVERLIREGIRLDQLRTKSIPDKLLNDLDIK
ncbi:hypothetical protein ACO9S2_14020 [Nitrospira sp. NS4]|uniref:hypothetical protein n=1 Tax=Nitrospira sp. NS4 TaxID=3414498 RepID=UPI003C2B7185